LALLDEHIDGKYEILEKLREGGMGAIYKVRHRLLDEVRVVKVIRSNMAPSPDAGDRFLREARVAIRLRHPNIAQLHDFAIGTDGNAYIIMEFIDGWTLQEILQRQGPPPAALSLEIARQSLKALGYLHRQKIVHRDVAPDNLMLTWDVDGHALVKLIDLGIAKAFEGGAGALTSTGIFLGKPRYASPEQFGGTGLDARSDLYSFGVVLYELLTGRCPVSGNDPASFMAGHLLRPPLPFAESDPEGKLPPALREALLQALAKEPAQRFGSAEEMLWAVTMVQDQLDPPTPDDLARLLAPAPEEDPASPARPGSTQDRLDREFWMTQTPPPQRVAATELIVPPLGGSLIESVQTQRLPLANEDPERTRRTVPPAVGGDGSGTVAIPAPKLSVLDDMTWVTSPTRSLPPATPPPAPAAQAAPSRGPKIALAGAAAVLVLALGAAGVWWLRRPQPAPVPPRPVPQEEVAEPSPAASVEPASSPASSSPPVTEEYRATQTTRKPASAAPTPAPAPTPAQPPPPMQRGDLIQSNLPNVEAAELISFPQYSYPAAARGSGKKVKVRVAVLVDENGKVIDAAVRESDEPGLGFNEAALEAARKAPFAPGARDGIAGKMWSELIFEFAE
jgi:serine/threonine-protein kinase